MLSNNNFHFELMNNAVLSSFTQLRDGEIKLGEKISSGIPNESTRFLILGIEESIGPKGNYGLQGAENAFHSFLMRFLNMQSNRFLSGTDVTILGTIKTLKSDLSISDSRIAIEELDALLEDVLITYSNEKITPIIIGGGHNNTFPIINAISKIYKESLFVVNCDPHADCRKLEGRHSGNGFSYAFEKGSLSAYCPIGLHKAYNSEHIYTFLEQNNCYYTYFEDYIKNPEGFYEDLNVICDRAKHKVVGLDVDLDSIAFMPSSAFTPSGLQLEHVRYLVQKIGSLNETKYLHLTEGAANNETEKKTIGKTLAYLCWDFITQKQNRTGI